ncbi:hypothetical protein [Synoicihabitans lomoniglobus]|uniref:Uncharacterized protein n=1 Tax=Synoicihabitans lomoniglobus TaxID=2909285 RepID=A0AAF0CP42_9BACT|nr:hypothetical protein [Opitutaceae bacterium LMO-M01]WED65390.1 hypothetical protein PXH66_00820 [Opitutaceae bacterium LMO-M01]
MNRDEETVLKYLQTLTLGSVVHEPYLNETPDFAINSEIGVEVRRLDEQYFTEDNPQGLDVRGIPIWHLTDKICREFPKTNDAKTYWVTTFIRRPLPSNKNYRQALSRALADFEQNLEAKDYRAKILPNVELEIRYLGPVAGLDENRFALAGLEDLDQGGWLLSLLPQNLTHCMQEKSKKVAPYLDRYDRWWLVLVDYIALHLNAEEQAQVISTCPRIAPWEKVVLLHPTKGKALLSY